MTEQPVPAPAMDDDAGDDAAGGPLEAEHDLDPAEFAPDPDVDV